MRHNAFTAGLSQATLQGDGVGEGTLQHEGVPDASVWRKSRAERTTWSPALGGVMLVSAWPRGDAELMLARVTMCTGGSDPAIRHVTSRVELHALVDEWLTALDDGKL